MAQFGSLLENDVVVTVRARLDLREDQAKLICMELSKPELVAGAVPLLIEVSTNSLSDEIVRRLREVLADHPGPSPVILQVGSKQIQLPAEFHVDSRNGLVGELRTLRGVSTIRA